MYNVMNNGATGGATLPQTQQVARHSLSYTPFFDHCSPPTDFQKFSMAAHLSLSSLWIGVQIPGACTGDLVGAAVVGASVGALVVGASVEDLVGGGVGASVVGDKVTACVREDVEGVSQQFSFSNSIFSFSNSITALIPILSDTILFASLHVNCL